MYNFDDPKTLFNVWKLTLPLSEEEEEEEEEEEDLYEKHRALAEQKKNKRKKKKKGIEILPEDPSLMTEGEDKRGITYKIMKNKASSTVF